MAAVLAWCSAGGRRCAACCQVRQLL
jgi:hypothetical protein